MSYPILVQPVLDAKCAGCHTDAIAEGEKNCPDLSRRGTSTDATGWYTSYNNLRPYAFFWDNAVFDAQPATTPGRFGARASKLYQLLQQGHHDVRLTAAELHRIALWLDCNSDFYGSYENLRRQEQGETVEPTLE